MLGADEILELYKRRKNDQHPLIDRMREVRDVYDGEVVIPLPELDESERPAVANLLQQGLDQTSMRIASVMPDVQYVPTKPGFKEHEERSRVRRNATLGWWHENRLKLQMRKRARLLTGYGMAPVMLAPDERRKIPRWQIRDPLTTFPSPGMEPDDPCPLDCIFAYRRSIAWLRSNYPDAYFGLYLGDDPRPDDVIDCIEYVDDTQHTLIAAGKARNNHYDTEQDTWGGCALLETMDNLAGICPVVIPARINLGFPRGQFDGMIGMYLNAAKLTALELIAVQKGIFPTTYLVSRQGELAKFIAGPFEGRTGQVNIVQGGDVKEVALNPGYQTNPAIDRLERAARLTGGVPAEFGGESGSNIRTGRRGDQVLSAVVDFPIQEAQEIFSYALQEENRRAIAIDKAYFDHPKSFYVNWKGLRNQRVDYTPSEHFDSDINFVTYSHPGSDANSLIVGLGQRVGMGTMSTDTAQEIDPYIDDPETERDRIVTGTLKRALLAGLETGVTQGQIPPTDVARLIKLVERDKKDLVDAIEQVQREAQERQATSGPPGSPEAPVEPGAPEAQPGIAAPGAGAEAGVAIPEPTASSGNLATLLNQMRGVRQNM